MSQQPSTHKAGKGFFAVLAICLIAVGGVAVMNFTETDTPPVVDLPDTTTTAALSSVTTTSAAPAAAATVYDPPTTVPTTATEAPTDLFVSPLGSTVIAAFSEDPVYSETMDDYRVHLGIDFAGDEGDRVRALADGTVTAFENDPLWGGSLTIEHGGGIVSVYRGVRAAVEIGDTVSVGDDVGALDSIPCESATGPHLHLELYQNEVAIDAAQLLKSRLNVMN
ncbi:MAG: M23 family metallopeptidase [Clostridia bacterium]|nr:M23 family metallopeptidase [Clostridia bacterium]